MNAIALQEAAIRCTRNQSVSTAYNTKVILTALQMLKDTPIADRRNAGICAALTDFDMVVSLPARAVTTLLQSAFKSWPFNAQDNTWSLPVGPLHEYWSEIDSKSVWANPRRIALLDFCIEYFKAQVHADELTVWRKHV